MRRISTDYEWRKAIQEYQAVKADRLKEGPAGKAIYYETANFGRILSARNAANARRILVQY